MLGAGKRSPLLPADSAAPLNFACGASGKTPRCARSVTVSQAAEELDALKGHDFSRVIDAESTSDLAAEGSILPGSSESVRFSAAC
jgi:hypothetical protein